jgi:chromosome partitioning protein
MHIIAVASQKGGPGKTTLAGHLAVAAYRAGAGPVALAPVVIHHRTGFAASMIDGRTVMEIAGDERSAAEIMQLWDYLSRRLSRDYRTMLPSEMAVPARGAA